MENWNLEEKQFQQTLQEIQALTVSLEQNSGLWTHTAVSLLVGLRSYEQLCMRIDEVYALSLLAVTIDPDSVEATIRFEQVEEMMFDVQERVMFLGQEALQVSTDRFVELSDQMPELRSYINYWEKLLKEQETLLEEVQAKLMDLEETGQRMEHQFETLMLKDLMIPHVMDEHGQPMQVSVHNFPRLLREATSAEVRESIFKAVYSTFQNYGPKFFAIHSKFVQTKIQAASLRGHASVWKEVWGNNPDELAWYERMTEEIYGNIELSHELVNLRQRCFAVKEVRPVDLFRSLTEVQMPRIPLDQAWQIILYAAGQVGEEYQACVERAIPNVVIGLDLPPAFSINSYRKGPMALSSYDGSVASLLTLAHEAGHLAHMQTANQAQHYVYSEAELLPSEVAALLLEILVLEYLIDQAESAEENEYIRFVAIEKYRHTLFRSSLWNEFEKQTYEMYQRGNASMENLVELYLNVQEQYLGHTFSQDALYGYDWVRVPHLFTPFYAGRYPLAFVTAVDFIERMKNDPAAERRLLEFLQAGGSRKTDELLALLECDLLRPEPYRRVFMKLRGYINKFENITK